MAFAGNLDAINVHPFEFVVGEYLHLFTVCVVPCHIVAVCIFILVGGVLASLNHTRFDIELPRGLLLLVGSRLCGLVGMSPSEFESWVDQLCQRVCLYCVRVHDVHHRLPESNYGQYIMLWDHVFGSYRAYNNTTSILNNKDD